VRHGRAVIDIIGETNAGLTPTTKKTRKFLRTSIPAFAGFVSFVVLHDLGPAQSKKLPI
jgi:hypothetical protein